MRRPSARSHPPVRGTRSRRTSFAGGSRRSRKGSTATCRWSTASCSSSPNRIGPLPSPGLSRTAIRRAGGRHVLLERHPVPDGVAVRTGCTPRPSDGCRARLPEPVPCRRGDPGGGMRGRGIRSGVPRCPVTPRRGRGVRPLSGTGRQTRCAPEGRNGTLVTLPPSKEDGHGSSTGNPMEGCPSSRPQR